MVNSRINTKKYFLPMYILWAILTPTLVTIMSGIYLAEDGMSVFSAIPWDRVVAFYALFGLIWPLTLVIAPAFFQSVAESTNPTYIFWGNVLFPLAWIGPLIHLIVAVYFHKIDVSKQTDEPENFGWIDYFAAFV